MIIKWAGKGLWKKIKFAWFDSENKMFDEYWGDFRYEHAKLWFGTNVDLNSIESFIAFWKRVVEDTEKIRSRITCNGVPIISEYRVMEELLNNHAWGFKNDLEENFNWARYITEHFSEELKIFP